MRWWKARTIPTNWVTLRVEHSMDIRDVAAWWINSFITGGLIRDLDTGEQMVPLPRSKAQLERRLKKELHFALLAGNSFEGSPGTEQISELIHWEADLARVVKRILALYELDKDGEQ